MSKTLAELLADAAAADDLEFAGPDGMKVKLADIRGFRSAVETERQQAERMRKEATTTAQQAKEIFDALKSAQEEFAKQSAPKPEPKGSDWKKNPLYDELVPVIEAAEAAAREARDTAKNLEKSLSLSQATYAAERLRREWAEAKVKPKDKKFEDVVAEVLAAKELDEFGLPTISKYLHRATEQDRMEAYATQKIEEAKKDWEKKAHAASIPKPGKFQTRKDTAAPIKDLKDLNSETVANDPEIQALIEGMVQ